MAAKIKVLSKEEQDELNELNSLNSDQADLDELNALNANVSPMTAFKNLSKQSGPILNALDLERRYASPAAVLGYLRPDLLEESERGSGFLPNQSQFPSMAELLNRMAEKKGETPLERAMYQPMIQGFGLLTDMVTPSTVLSLGASKLANAPKWAQRSARSYEALANPIGELFSAGKPLLEGGGEIISKGGRALYSRPFAKMDAASDVKKNALRVSSLAREYGITGNYQQILTKLRDKFEQEGKNIGNTVSRLNEKLSPNEIRIMSDQAAQKKLGEMHDRESILNYINDELDMLTPAQTTENMAKYIAEKNRYNKSIADAEKDLISVNKYSPEYLQTLARHEEELSKIPYGSYEYMKALDRQKQELSGVNEFTPEYSLKLAQQNESMRGQGRLFEQPETKQFQETVPFTTESRSSKVVGGDFTPQSSEMGTFKVTEPASGEDIKFWEVDPRNPQLKRGFAAPPMYGTNKTAPNEVANGQFLSDLIGPSQPVPQGSLPAGIPNNYSQRPRIIDEVTRTTKEVPLPSKSAVDVNPQNGFLIPTDLPEVLVEPKMPNEKIFSFSDLFNLKQNVAEKGFSGVPNRLTGATNKIKSSPATDIYGAYDTAIRSQVEKELGAEEAARLSESIAKYNQKFKNKEGMTLLENAAKKQNAEPIIGWKNIDLSKPVQAGFDLIPNFLVPSTGAQTRAGMMLMKSGKKFGPWAIKTGKISSKGIPAYLINDKYEQE